MGKVERIRLESTGALYESAVHSPLCIICMPLVWAPNRAAVAVKKTTYLAVLRLTSLGIFS